MKIVYKDMKSKVKQMSYPDPMEEEDLDTSEELKCFLTLNSFLLLYYHKVDEDYGIIKFIQ